jgi:tetratricopeptide (TPR) repeat protein
VVYPHPALTPAGMPWILVALSGVALLAISGLVAWQWSARPFLAAGWLWYLLTLVPVIGLVQVGPQGLADRYTYLPLIGIFVACAWTIPDATGRPLRRYLTVGGALLVIAVAAEAARVQTRYWRDSVTLFRRALAVTRDNATALRNLGIAYAERRQYEPGIAALRESLRLMPGDAWAWMDLGVALSTTGDNEAAGRAFREAVQLRPDDGDVLFNFGVFSAMVGEVATARAVYARLLLLRPELAEELATRAGIR